VLPSDLKGSVPCALRMQSALHALNEVCSDKDTACLICSAYSEWSVLSVLRYGCCVLDTAQEPYSPTDTEPACRPAGTGQLLGGLLD